MEWMNRAGRPAQPAHTTAPSTTAHTAVPHDPNNSNKRKTYHGTGLQRFSFVLLLFAITFLMLALNAYLIFGRFTTREARYVNEDKMQAVFLDGGQVYFGKIRAMNPSYIGMSNIYYLRVNQQVQPKQGETAQQDISLVKLGCELHGPTDEMFINRSKILFWENLKADSQVAKAVENYIKQNPDGQKCDATTGDASGTDNSSTPTPTTTTPTTTTPTTKKP